MIDLNNLEKVTLLIRFSQDSDQWFIHVSDANETDSEDVITYPVPALQMEMFKEMAKGMIS